VTKEDGKDVTPGQKKEYEKDITQDQKKKYLILQTLVYQKIFL